MSGFSNPLTLVKDEARRLNYQLKEDGVEKDITGMTFKLGAKEDISDTSPKFEIDGDISVAATGKFYFDITTTETGTAFAGIYEISMYNGSGDKTVLTDPGGADFEIVGEIVAN